MTRREIIQAQGNTETNSLYTWESGSVNDKKKYLICDKCYVKLFTHIFEVLQELSKTGGVIIFHMIKIRLEV